MSGRTVWPGVALLSAALAIAACGRQPAPVQEDPLPSWRDGEVKTAIVGFVSRVTDRSSPEYVAPAERVAAFDNDGTLIVERPALVQLEFVHDRIRALASEHPEWETTEPFRSVLANDRESLAAMSFRERGEIVAQAQANLFTADFVAAVRRFLATGAHPRFDVRYAELAYQPMLELIDYLRANDFRVFIVSGGGIEFIRQFSESVYGVPREYVIGSSAKTELRQHDGKLATYRKPGWQSLNVGRYKALNLQLHAGRRPILAVGNSDGDLDMLRFTHDHSLPTLVLLLEHDDADREYAYVDDAQQVTAAAERFGWPIVSMRDDFATLFAPAR